MNPTKPNTTADAGLQHQNSVPPKVIGKPFKPGVSGNPSGRRRGSVSLTATLKKRLTKADARAIADKLIQQAKAGNRDAIRHHPAPHSLSATGKAICRCGCERRSAGMNFIPAAHARSSTNGRQKVSSVPCPSVNRDASEASGFSISPASSRLLSDAKPVPKIVLPVSLYARLPR